MSPTLPAARSDDGGRVVVLDRDGTLNAEVHYLSHPDQVALLPGVAEGLRALRSAGCRLVVVTNQSAIGRGYFDEARLDAIHDRLRALLRALSFAGYSRSANRSE